MENQGQRELKLIRHVYGALVIYEVFQRNVWHKCILTFKLDYASDKQVLGLIVSSQVQYIVQDICWPVTWRYLKVAMICISNEDIHCDDLLWLESLIDGWGQILTLNCWKSHDFGHISLIQFSSLSFSGESSSYGKLHPFSIQPCPSEVDFLRLIYDWKLWWYNRSGNTVKGIQAQQGWNVS